MNSCNGQPVQPVVRPATQANRFYEGNSRRLSQEVDSLLRLHSGSAHFDNVAAIIVPHAGYYFSGRVAASAYMSLNPRTRYKRIFLLGPSHHEWFDGASVNTEADYYDFSDKYMYLPFPRDCRLANGMKEVLGWEYLNGASNEGAE